MERLASICRRVPVACEQIPIVNLSHIWFRRGASHEQVRILDRTLRRCFCRRSFFSDLLSTTAGAPLLPVRRLSCRAAARLALLEIGGARDGVCLCTSFPGNARPYGRPIQAAN